jgi:hypothetical protein
MFQGTLIVESMIPGSTLTGVPLVVREVSRSEPLPNREPTIWSAIEFEGDDSVAEALADRLAAILDHEGGWYANFSSASETFVVYHGKIFRYPRGDAEGRAQAQAYGRAHGVPERELDWTE